MQIFYALRLLLSSVVSSSIPAHINYCRPLGLGRLISILVYRVAFSFFQSQDIPIDRDKQER